MWAAKRRGQGFTSAPTVLRASTTPPSARNSASTVRLAASRTAHVHYRARIVTTRALRARRTRVAVVTRPARAARAARPNQAGSRYRRLFRVCSWKIPAGHRPHEVYCVRQRHIPAQRRQHLVPQVQLRLPCWSVPHPVRRLGRWRLLHVRERPVQGCGPGPELPRVAAARMLPRVALRGVCSVMASPSGRINWAYSCKKVTKCGYRVRGHAADSHVRP